MLTFFTTAKPFEGHSGIIQRNALQSWKLLHPDVEIILFGNEPGVPEICREMGLRHEPHVERHESGMKYLDYMFSRAQAIALHPYLCYSNCDIILMKDFWAGFERVLAAKRSFLLVGQRWDTDVTELVDFASPSWGSGLRQFARAHGILQKRHFVDYFAFPKDLYDRVPKLVVGRSYWDHWLVWKALSIPAPVVDGTKFFVAIHQNHGYAYHPQGKAGTNDDPLAMQNRALAGNGREQKSLLDANYELTQSGQVRRVLFRRQMDDIRNAFTWQFVLQKSFGVRSRLGLRRTPLRRLYGKILRQPPSAHDDRKVV